MTAPPRLPLLLTATLVACGPGSSGSTGSTQPALTVTTTAHPSPSPSASNATPNRRSAAAFPQLPAPERGRSITVRSLSAEQASCVQRLPRSATAAVTLPGDDTTRVTELLWIAEGGPPSCPDPILCGTATQRVTLRLQRGSASRDFSFESAAGDLLPLDLSACDEQPRASTGCARMNPPKPPGASQGILARFAVIRTYGYSTQDVHRWTVVHDGSNLLVIESTSLRFPWIDDLCNPETSRVVVSLPLPASGRLQEAIFESTPSAPEPREIDCPAAWTSEGRCTG